MTANEAQTLFEQLATAFAEAEGRLGSLDAAVGDGDHGVGMARGFAAAALAANQLPGDPDASEVVQVAGRALMSAIGGASGPLFATLFLEVGKALEGVDDPKNAVAAGLANAVERIQRFGKAAPGDKTMLDALVPAAEAFAATADDLTSALLAAQEAAQQGVEASAELPAKRGRARYVEGAGVGHPDPGAVSIALLFDTWSALHSATERDS